MFKKLVTKRNTIIFSIIVVVLIIIFLVTRPKDTTPKYVTSPATKTAITSSVTASGSVIINKEQNASFNTGGRITQINVKVGDTVTTGQDLADIDATTLAAQVSQAQSQLNVANTNVRSKKAVGNYSKYDIANLQQSIISAQAQLNNNSYNLNQATLVSPITGTITSINAGIGDTVGAQSGGSAFIVITDSSNNQKNVNFATSGKIAEVDVSIGQHVTTNQQLAKLDATTLNNQVTQSQASLNQAYNNLHNKYATDTTSYELSNLQESVSSAQATLNIDQYNLGNANLRSNLTGIVTNINNSVGDTVSGAGSNSSTTSTAQQAAVIVIVDPSSYEISLTVGETDIPKINIGQLVQISFDALGAKQYVGKVQSIDTIGTTTSNVVSYSVKVAINQVDNSIKPGMTANATIITDSKDNVIVVPNSAIKTTGGQKIVQVLDTNNQLQQIPVTTGLIGDSNTEITSGISECDNIVISTIRGQAATAASTTGSGGLFGGVGTGGRGTGTGRPAGN